MEFILKEHLLFRVFVQKGFVKAFLNSQQKLLRLHISIAEAKIRGRKLKLSFKALRRFKTQALNNWSQEK